jgi:hypothetical protein
LFPQFSHVHLIQDKLVVNGVDLVNRDELSVSQQRELQRYIDANAHLLGFLDKEKEAKEAADAGGVYRGGTYNTSLASLAGAAAAAGAAKAAEAGANNRAGANSEATAADALASPRHQYQSYSLGRAPPPLSSQYEDSSSAYARPPSATQSLNRMGAGSPSSEYGYGGPGKRKGVSWSDVVDPSPVPGRARSNSPPNISSYRNSVGWKNDGSKTSYFRVTSATPWPSLTMPIAGITGTPRWHATEVRPIQQLTSKGCGQPNTLFPKLKLPQIDFI